MRPLIEVLNDQSFHLPKRIEGSSMSAYLRRQFSAYIDSLDDISEPAFRSVIDPLKVDILRFCEAVPETIEMYFHGDPPAAFQILE